MARHHSLLIPSICNTSIQIYSIPCMYATDTAQVMTPTHTGTACNQPMQVHMYYYNPIFVSFRHSRPCIVQVLLHATRYQSLLSALLRLASLLSFHPRIACCRRCRQSSDVTSTELVRFVFLASSGYGGSSVMRMSNDTGICIIKPIVRD